MTGPVCVWRFTVDRFWATECGREFEFTNDGPRENGFKACPYCGKHLEQDDTYGPDADGDFIDPDEPKEDA